MLFLSMFFVFGVVFVVFVVFVKIYGNIKNDNLTDEEKDILYRICNDT